MEHKNIVATIYLKDGKAIKARDNYEEYPDVIELAKLYNDSGNRWMPIPGNVLRRAWRCWKNAWKTWNEAVC